MADSHRVVITSSALADLEAIAGHVHAASPQAAASLAGKILKAIESLASMPTRFRKSGTSRKRGTPVHSVVVRPYVIYYRVDESPPTVHILNRQARRAPAAATVRIAQLSTQRSS